MNDRPTTPPDQIETGACQDGMTDEERGYYCGKSKRDSVTVAAWCSLGFVLLLLAAGAIWLAEKLQAWIRLAG